MEADLIRERLHEALSRAMDRACANSPRCGIDDCALWAADVLKDALGYDPARPYRGVYDCPVGAHLVSGKLGLGYLIRSIARQRNWRRLDPSIAQVGDVGLAVTPDPTIVLCRAPGWFVGRYDEMCGFVALPACNVRVAWSVL